MRSVKCGFNLLNLITMCGAKYEWIERKKNDVQENMMNPIVCVFFTLVCRLAQESTEKTLNFCEKIVYGSGERAGH